MASVFLSYDSEDVGRARPIAAALEKAGHSVWWDRHIKGGAQYAKEIERALKSAEAVVVLWSRRAVESAWVRDEAAAGRDSGRLVPITLDGAEPPLGFRQYQTIDLSRWTGRRSARLRAVVEAVEALSQPLEAAIKPRSTPAQRQRARRIPVAAMAGLAVLLILAIGAVTFAWRPWAHQSVTLVAVAPGDGNPASLDFTRDLMVKLGSLATAHSGSMRLVEGNDRSAQNDLLLEAAGTVTAGATRSSLVLKGRKDRAILWSKDFEQLSTNLADLKQQMAFTSARVLGCALDGMQAGERLKPEILKIYLNACAQLADVGSTDPSPVIPMLTMVVRDAPRFKPAWSKLLLAQAEIVGRLFNQGKTPDPQAVNSLREHIRRARQVEPNIAEALLAEAQLVPPREISRATSLVRRAAEHSPENPIVVSYWSGALARVGRTGEAVEFAERAAKLDPLSPDALQHYISALAYAGRIEAAERQLRGAERLWYGTAALRDAQYRFHLRYGDPKLALSMEESDTPGGTTRLYLRTRLEPTEANVEQLIAAIKRRIVTMRNPTGGVGFATLAYGRFGANEELFRLLLSWPKPDDLGAIAESLFRPELQQFRRDPRFMQLAHRAGLLEYWRTSGEWPDFCFDSDHTYACKAEAAKIAT